MKFKTTIRLSEEERDEIKFRADRAGLSVNQYIVKSAISSFILSPIPIQHAIMHVCNLYTLANELDEGVKKKFLREVDLLWQDLTHF